VAADDHRMDDLPLDPVMRRWWAHMADLMATQPDGAPVAVPLIPMFYLP
jgi:L-rhamnose mutarotase